jgi:hypothetical protein
MAINFPLKKEWRFGRSIVWEKRSTLSRFGFITDLGRPSAL